MDQKNFEDARVKLRTGYILCFTCHLLLLFFCRSNSLLLVSLGENDDVNLALFSEAIAVSFGAYRAVIISSLDSNLNLCLFRCWDFASDRRNFAVIIWYDSNECITSKVSDIHFYLRFSQIWIRMWYVNSFVLILLLFSFIF